VSLVQCLGADVLSAEIHLPGRGVWWANLRLDTTALPALKSAATITALNGLSLTGSVAKAGVDTNLLALHLHVVGGGASTGLVVGPWAYQSAVVGDVLASIQSATRENLSSTIPQSVSRLQLGTWTVTQRHAARQLDELCYFVQQSLGGIVNWRMLSDATIWLGPETWPSVSLPKGADVVTQHPVNPWFEIACETPTLLPGVNLSDIGGINVSGVDHWIEHNRIRTWAWTA
jgi:hypothetical protein